MTSSLGYRPCWSCKHSMEEVRMFRLFNYMERSKLFLCSECFFREMSIEIPKKEQHSCYFCALMSPTFSQLGVRIDYGIKLGVALICTDCFNTNYGPYIFNRAASTYVFKE